MDIVFDTYEMRARVAPSVIVAFPILVTLWFWFSATGSSWQILTGSGILSVAVLYGFTFIVRWLGRAGEKSLWRSWGGAPSTRVLRWQDTTLNRDVKTRIREVSFNTFGIQLLSETEELASPHTADQRIETCFSQIKEILRLRDKDGLWLKHNAEYGFGRNLLGCRSLFLILGVIGALICGTIGKSTGRGVFNFGTVINSVSCIVWATFAWGLLPKIVRDAAERYAERAWLTFLALASEPSKKS